MKPEVALKIEYDIFKKYTNIARYLCVKFAVLKQKKLILMELFIISA